MIRGSLQGAGRQGDEEEVHDVRLSMMRGRTKFQGLSEEEDGSGLLWPPLPCESPGGDTVAGRH